MRLRTAAVMMTAQLSVLTAEKKYQVCVYTLENDTHKMLISFKLDALR